MKRHELGAGKRLCKSHLFSAGSFISFLLEYNCFTVLLVSAEQQGESAACIHTALPSSASLPSQPLIPPLKVITVHWAELPVLCSSFPLAVFFFKRGSIYMIMLLSQSHFSPWPCPQVCFLHLHLYPCPANRFIGIIFYIPYICINIQYLFFSF